MNVAVLGTGIVGRTVTGGYFANRKPKKSNKASYDTEATARLWQSSADLVGLPTAGR